MNRQPVRRHLDQVRDTVTEVDRILSSHTYPSDPRTVMVRGLLSTIIQHHRSLLLLIKSGAVASSYALTRDIIKGFRFGLWVISCAAQEQVLQIEGDDEFPLGLPAMIKEIEGAYRTDPFFHDLKNRWETQLYKYTRSGIVQLGRWHTGSCSGLVFDEAEIRDVTTVATLCVALLAAKFLADQKHSAASKQIEKLAAGLRSAHFVKEFDTEFVKSRNSLG